MYKKGDRVIVEGFGGKRAVLRVWEHTAKGVWMCSEEGYQDLISNRDAPIVGFPHKDVIGLVENELSQAQK